MKIPVYENQVSPRVVRAAQPNMGEPVRAAFGTAEARALQNLAHSAGQAALTAANIGARKEAADALQQREAEVAAEKQQRAKERTEQREQHLRKTAALLGWRKDNDALLNGRLDENGRNVEGGLLARQYTDATGISGDYNRQATALMEKYLAAAQTPEEREELALEMQEDFQRRFNQVAAYELKQQRAAGDLLSKAYRQNKLQELAENPERLQAVLAGITANSRENLNANGVPRELQSLEFVALNSNAVNVAVSTFLERGQTQEAAQTLQAYRGKIDAHTAQTLGRAVYAAAVEDLKQHWGQSLEQLRGADGTIDFAAAREYIAKGSNPQPVKDELLKYTETREQDEARARKARQQARDESFYGALDEWNQAGGTLENGLKLAAQYAGGAKDKMTKEKIVRELFDAKNARAKQSDPEEYLRLYKGVLDGSADEEALRSSYVRNFITAADYRALRKELAADANGKQERSFALKQIEAQAYAKVPDSQARRVYLTEVQRQSQGKSAAEMFSIADKLLEKSGGFWMFGGTPKYQHDAERNAEQQRTMGDYLQSGDGNLDTFNAFVGFVRENADDGHDWNAADWENFKQKYPHIERRGTPENRALLSLAASGKPLTAANLSAVIDMAYGMQGQTSPDTRKKQIKIYRDKKAVEGSVAIITQLMPFVQETDAEQAYGKFTD